MKQGVFMVAGTLATGEREPNEDAPAGSASLGNSGWCHADLREHETRRATYDPSDKGIDDTFVSVLRCARTKAN